MPDVPSSQRNYPVFKGLGRKPTFMGVPTTLLFSSFIFIGFIAMLAGLVWWGLLVVVLPSLAWFTRHDDKAIDVLWLEIITRGLNRNKTFWSGSSYAPSGYLPHRPCLHPQNLPYCTHHATFETTHQHTATTNCPQTER